MRLYRTRNMIMKKITLICLLIVLFTSMICMKVMATGDSDSDMDILSTESNVLSIEDGKIVKSDGSVEYGTPDSELSELNVKQFVSDAEYFDRYSYHSNVNAVMPLYIKDEMTVDIQKRIQWTDASNGDAKVTLKYTSNSGTFRGMEDMNVMLLHDKSGSMDVNYGYNLEVARKGWGQPAAAKYYPIQNTMGWSETVDSFLSEENYGRRLNYKDAASGYEGFDNGWLNNGEMLYASPCQVSNHYYLTIQKDDVSNLSGWTMVHGNYLYNIASTDLHHYRMITKQEALDEYLPLGRRVVRLISGSYYDENGEVYVSAENPVYFLDESQVVKHDGKWILNACGLQECQTNDRLANSQSFMSQLASEVQMMNPDNKISYIPFWGDVPMNGSWNNASSNNTSDGLFSDNDGRMTYKQGVTKIDFTTNLDMIQSQIDNPFTYDGTNWSRAFQSAIAFLNQRSPVDKEKKDIDFISYRWQTWWNCR